MSASVFSSTVTTKERILDAAEEIMLQKSFHSVGLNEILSAVKVPKGSFYHYFQSKEQFGVELLKHYVAGASAYKRRALLTNELSENPYERLIAYFDLHIAKLMENGCQCSCLIAKLATEVATFSDDMRAVLAEGGREWTGYLEKVLIEGQDKGVIRRDLDPRATALLMHDLWMGASLRMQVERSVAPLRSVSVFLRQYLSLA
jgi:TetR/AcrR family transcriptional repressor of nem operon